MTFKNRIYLYSYSHDFPNPNIIRICIHSFQKMYKIPWSTKNPWGSRETKIWKCHQPTDRLGYVLEMLTLGISEKKAARDQDGKLHFNFKVNEGDEKQNQGQWRQWRSDSKVRKFFLQDQIPFPDQISFPEQILFPDHPIVSRIISDWQAANVIGKDINTNTWDIQIHGIFKHKYTNTNKTKVHWKVWKNIPMISAFFCTITWNE